MYVNEIFRQFLFKRVLEFFEDFLKINYNEYIKKNCNSSM